MIEGMVRADDHSTSVDAAVAISLQLNDLHKKVIAAFRSRGPMTDEQLEQLPDFVTYGPSTIRKRRSELYQDGRLVEVRIDVNSRNRKMKVWALA